MAVTSVSTRPEIEIDQGRLVVALDERVDVALERVQVEVLVVTRPAEEHVDDGPGLAFDQPSRS